MLFGVCVLKLGGSSAGAHAFIEKRAGYAEAEKPSSWESLHNHACRLFEKRFEVHIFLHNPFPIIRLD